MTLCDREGKGVWLMRIYAWAKNYKHSFISLSPIFTGLSCLVLFFFRRLSRFCLLFSVIHSFIHYMFVDFIVYYFILDVTICHIITVKSLIVVIRKPSFFGGGLDRCDNYVGGGNLV